MQVNLPYAPVLNKNPYVGRTFIQPTEKARQSGVLRKFSPITASARDLPSLMGRREGAVEEVIRGKRIILVDDSIVRGTTMRPIVALLKESGAAAVHIRVASPPIKSPCFYGINIPAAADLIAARLPLQAIADEFQADSIAYLSLQGLKVSTDSNPRHGWRSNDPGRGLW